MERELERRVAELGPWFHNLHLPGGVETAPDHPLGDFPSTKWGQLAPHLPESLEGWSALDVGCNAGFYSFELSRRGARVVGIDHDPRYLAQARFAARVLGMEGRVEFREQDAYSLAGEEQGYDLVLFFGVFYHLRYPLLVLDAIARLTGRLLAFQTMTLPDGEVFPAPLDMPLDPRDMMTEPGWPKMAFIEHRLDGDPTNWWAPNHAAVEALLRSSGFRVLARPGHEIYLCEPARENASSFWTWDEREYASATRGQRRESAGEGGGR